MRAGVSVPPSLPCLSGVQQQLPSGCTDEVAEGKHAQAGPGAHARAADSCRAGRGSDAPCGASDHGPPGRTQVSCFCQFTVSSPNGQSHSKVLSG